MPAELDKFDRRILAIVQRDARRSAEMIGTDIGLSASAVQRRMARLREDGVIVAEVALIDPRSVDQRLTVMAGIMVMDELTELQKRIKGMESEVQTLRKTRDDALLKADKNDQALTGALGALAQRMEDLAGSLAPRKAQ